MADSGNPTNTAEFIQAYFEAACFTSMDQSNEQGGEPLDKSYSVDDLAPEIKRRMIEDCKTFSC